MDSILLTIKKLLGIDEEYYHFDSDIIIAINTALNTLTQIGVGDPNGFTISDEKATWNDFLGEDKRIEFVKTYVHLQVRLIFDPPMNSSVTEVIRSKISELEWRINVQTDIKE